MAAVKPPPDGGDIPDLSLPPPAGRAPSPGSPAGEARKPQLGEDDIDWLEDFGAVPAQPTTAQPRGRQPLVSADFDWMEDAPAAPGKPAPPGGGGVEMDWLDSGSAGGKAAGGRYAGGGFEFDDDLADDFAADGGGMEVATPLAASPRRDLPSGVTPPLEDLEITDAEVATVARYGPKPAGFPLAPIYAVRVFQRRRALAAQVKALRAQLQRVESARDEVLADVAANWRPRLTQDERFHSLFQGVDDAERRLGVETSRLADANAGYRDRVRELETQRDRLERRRAELLEVESGLAADLAAREDEHRRLAAQLQRVRIVLRNAAQLEARAGDPAAGGRLPPDHAARVASAKRQLPIAEQAEAAQRQHVDEAGRRLREARSNTQVVNQELRQLDAQRRQLDRQFTQESSTRSLQVAEGEAEKRTAGADVTRALLATDLGAELGDDELAELKAQDAKVRRAAGEFHRHALALDAYDRQSYRSGVLLLGASAGLVLLLVLGVAFGACVGRSTPAPDSRGKPVAPPPADDGRFNASEEEWERSK